MAAIIDRAVRAVTSSRDVTYTILALNYSVQVLYNVKGKQNIYTQLIAAKRWYRL